VMSEYVVKGQEEPSCDSKFGHLRLLAPPNMTATIEVTR
jgi:hypothetical protein